MEKLSQQAERSKAAAARAVETASGKLAVLLGPAETATLILPEAAALDQLLQLTAAGEHARLCQPSCWSCLGLELWACAEGLA